MQFFVGHSATAGISTLSLHDALPICDGLVPGGPPRTQHRRRFERRGGVAIVRVQLHPRARGPAHGGLYARRSEEHTSELQSRRDLVCCLPLEKKKYVTARKGSSKSCE